MVPTELHTITATHANAIRPLRIFTYDLGTVETITALLRHRDWQNAQVKTEPVPKSRPAAPAPVVTGLTAPARASRRRKAAATPSDQDTP